MYRFVHIDDPDSPSLKDEFLSDRAMGKPPYGRREKKFDALRDGMSAFASLPAARARWIDMKAAADRRGEEVRAGDYVAELVFRPEDPFEVEDLGEVDEHLTIWGEPDALARSVSAVYTADISGH